MSASPLEPVASHCNVDLTQQIVIGASQNLDLGYWSARFEEYDSTGGFEAMSSALEHGGLSVCHREMPFGDALFEI